MNLVGDCGLIKLNRSLDPNPEAGGNWVRTDNQEEEGYLLLDGSPSSGTAQITLTFTKETLHISGCISCIAYLIRVPVVICSSHREQFPQESYLLL